MKTLYLLLCSFFTMVSLTAGEGVEQLNSENFEKKIKNGVVLVDFYADWCGPCRRMGPILDQVASEMQGKVAVYKVNINQSKDLSSQYEVQSLPTLILFKKGKEEGRLIGFQNKEAILNFAQSNH